MRIVFLIRFDQSNVGHPSDEQRTIDTVKFANIGRKRVASSIIPNLTSSTTLVTTNSMIRSWYEVELVPLVLSDRKIHLERI